jgi:hypothetical protein
MNCAYARVGSQWVAVRTERKRTGSGQMNNKTKSQSAMNIALVE